MDLGANSATRFVRFIYRHHGTLVGPFVGMFADPSYEYGVVDFSSIVALIVYALLAWLVVKLVWMLVGGRRCVVRAESIRRTV